MSESRSSSRIIRFGAFELTLDTGELRKAGRSIKLSPQPSKVLVLIIDQAGQLVTRQEIRQQVWGEETFVDFETGLNHCINQIRTALGDNAEIPRFVQTIPRRGYRFIAPVEEVSPPLADLDGHNPATLRSPSRSEPAASSEMSAAILDPLLSAGVAANEMTRTRRRAISGAIFVILAIAAIAVIHLLRQQRAALLTNQDTVVLGEFSNSADDPVFDGTLRQALAIQLEQSPFLSVLPDRKAMAVLKEMSRPENERLTQDVTREVCLRTNSKAYLLGSIAKFGDHYLIGLRALNCETDQTLASTDVEARNRNEVITALGDAGNQMRNKLGESLTSLEKFNKPLAEATTSSLEALQAFTMVRNTQHEKGDPASIAFAKRAVELDTNFAQGYATLGLLYRNLDQQALAAENLKKAYELRDRATQRERFFIEASYYSFATGELEKADETYNEWIQTYPRDVSSHVNLAVNYMRLGEYGNYLEQAQEARALTSDNANVYANLMASYLGLNRLVEAKAAFDEARTRKLDNQHLRANRYIVAFLQGDMAAMKEQLDAAMGRPGFEDKLLQAQSDTEAYYGRFANAREFSRRAVHSATLTDALETAGEYKAIEAMREAEVGNATLAKKTAMDALALSSGQQIEGMAALALARAGDVATAEKLADALSRQSPQDTMVQGYILPTVHAAIALASNKHERAVQILQVTSPYESSGFSFSSLYPAYLRGLAYLEAKHGKEAKIEFQKLLNQQGIVQNFVLGALAHLQLARAEAMGGEKAAAQTEYAAFLALWKEADTNLSILKQAKLEYARLH